MVKLKRIGVSKVTTGEKIAYYRKNNNYTQEELAYKMGVSRQTIYKWETELSFPTINNLKKLVDLLNIDLNDLIKEDGKDVKR